MATEEFVTYDAEGREVDRREIEVSPPPPEFSNGELMRSRVIEALRTNRTYLSNNSPTAAITSQQVKALTRQMNMLIRLSMGVLDGTD